MHSSTQSCIYGSFSLCSAKELV